MYQPISFNVIRQALEWHGMPMPTLRQLSFYSYDPDEIMAEYLVTWSAEQIRDATGFPLGWHGWYVPIFFLDRLKKCFCEDVTVFASDLPPSKEEFKAILYVTIAREALAAANVNCLDY